MSTPAPPELPWLSWRVGERVVLRHRGPDGGAEETLGYLTEVARDHVCVDTRRGNVRVDATAMITGKRVPPPPARRSRPDPTGPVGRD